MSIIRREKSRIGMYHVLLQNGASIRQMEKLTGIGRGVIQNL